jgi:hypothetical protein
VGRINLRHLEDCLDGSVLFEAELDRPFTGADITALRSFGDIEYYSDFPRPFFRFSLPGRFELKGVEGETRIKVLFARGSEEKDRADFLTFLTAHAGGSGR